MRVQSRRRALLVAGAVLLVAGVATAYFLLPKRMTPPVRTVDRLLTVRSELATDPATYEPLVGETSTAEALAQAAGVEAPEKLSPIPRWNRPYVSGQSSREATVVVVWKQDREHEPWPKATLFMLKRDPEAMFGWRVGDARTIGETGTVPAPSD